MNTLTFKLLDFPATGYTSGIAVLASGVGFGMCPLFVLWQLRISDCDRAEWWWRWDVGARHETLDAPYPSA
jgi:hypothetical protein